MDSSGFSAPVSKYVASVAAHGDEPVRAQKGLLVTSFAIGLPSGDARKLVDQRHDRSGCAPEIQVRINRDAGQGVDHDRVVRVRIERGTEPRGGSLLLFGRCSAGDDLLYLETPLPQAGDQARVVQVAARLAVRVSYRNERDAQDSSFSSGCPRGRRTSPPTPRCVRLAS